MSPPLGLLASASVTLEAKFEATFPKGSSAVTTSPNPLPAVTLPGGAVVTTSWLAVAAVTVMAPVVAELKPVPDALSVAPAPALLSVRPAKVATPALALTVEVPPSVAPLGFVANASVTLEAKLAATFPKGSSAVTTSPKPLPAVTLPGGAVVSTSWLAVAALTVMVLVVAELSPEPDA